MGSSELIDAPHEAPRLIAKAMQSMFTGRPGPAALECAIDVWGRSGPVPAKRHCRYQKHGSTKMPSNLPQSASAPPNGR